MICRTNEVQSVSFPQYETCLLEVVPKAESEKHFGVKHLANAGVVVHKLRTWRDIATVSGSEQATYLVHAAVDVHVHEPDMVLRAIMEFSRRDILLNNVNKTGVGTDVVFPNVQRQGSVKSIARHRQPLLKNWAFLLVNLDLRRNGTHLVSINEAIAEPHWWSTFLKWHGREGSCDEGGLQRGMSGGHGGEQVAVDIHQVPR